MTQKARVTRDRESGSWVATRPRLGFGGPEERSFPTQQQALAWVDGHIGRQGTLAATAERADGPGGMFGMEVVATPREGRPWWR